MTYEKKQKLVELLEEYEKEQVDILSRMFDIPKKDIYFTLVKMPEMIYKLDDDNPIKWIHELLCEL